MKYLYYNPIEFPENIRIVSQELGVDVTYSPWDGKRHGIMTVEEAFRAARLDVFDDVLIDMTEHNEPYFKDGKKSTNGYSISGWISCKEYKNGGGYLSDAYIETLNDEPLEDGDDVPVDISKMMFDPETKAILKEIKNEKGFVSVKDIMIAITSAGHSK